jgi:DNA-binding Xre family transcriptional regulator
MQLNADRFRRACRGAGQVNIARHLGISENALCIKLKDPATKLRVSEFLRICAFLDESLNHFLIKENHCHALD